jgi:hypothetical protein
LDSWRDGKEKTSGRFLAEYWKQIKCVGGGRTEKIRKQREKDAMVSSNIVVCFVLFMLWYLLLDG